jgi:peptidoglycan/LPS O-acetylase OafA/YrhL
METVPLGRPAPLPPPKRSQNLSRVPYLPGLDGMRAIAVVAVMIYHANSSWLPGGYLGVEVFFVISGYLITLLLISEHEKSGRVALGQFWLRRARRLLPALFTMMILLIMYTAFFQKEALGMLRGDVIAGFFYVSNWYQIWVGAGYTADADFAPLRHLWSLAVEEQFYLLWPILMAFLLSRKKGRIGDVGRWFLLASVLITVFIALVYHPGSVGTCDQNPEAYWQLGDRCISKNDFLYLSTPTRAGGLLIGAAFAMIWRPVAVMRSPMRRKAGLVDLIALVGLLGLAGLVWSMHLATVSGFDPWLFRGGFLLCGVVTVMIIAGATHARTVSGKLLSIPVLLWIGTRSYGLYLYHWPIYQIIREQSGVELSFAEFALAMVLTAAITEVSFRLIETPIRRGRAKVWWHRLRAQRDPTPRRIIAAGGAMCIAVASVAGVQMATAQVQPNEIQQSLDEGREFITDPFEDDPGQVGPATTDDTAAPGTSGPTATPPTTEPSDDPPASQPNVPPPSDPSSPTTTRPPRRTTTTTTEPPVEPGQPWAIGDSVMLGAAQALDGYGFAVDAQTSRSFGNGYDSLSRLRDDGLLGEQLVIHLGANDTTVSAEDLDEMMALLPDVNRVLFVTVRLDRPDIYGLNESIRALPAEYPNVKVLDWAEVGNRCPGECFYTDNLHLRPEGAEFYAQRIAGAVGLR